jgi:hypothetical protein
MIKIETNKKNERLIKIGIFVFTLLLTLIMFLILQPKQNENPIIGFNLNLYINNNTCFHIHHWVYMLLLTLIIVTTVIFRNGHFTIPILIIMGFLIGGSLSDLAYSDFLHFTNTCH